VQTQDKTARRKVGYDESADGFKVWSDGIELGFLYRSDGWTVEKVQQACDLFSGWH
jgi:hypothetical protein